MVIILVIIYRRGNLLDDLDTLSEISDRGSGLLCLSSDTCDEDGVRGRDLGMRELDRTRLRDCLPILDF